MIAISTMGFQRGRSGFYLGQALSQADRDHYLSALSRAIREAGEIDGWIKDHPDLKFRPAPGSPASITDSPYYTKWINFQPHRDAMKALNDRLLSTDQTTWGSLTQDEHSTFGWVNVVDQVYSAVQADPLNLTAGHWQDGTRLADQPSGGALTPPTDTGVSTPVLLGIGLIGAIGLVVWITR